MNAQTSLKMSINILEKIAVNWTLPPNLKLSEWADRERRLSSEASAEPGQWRTSRVPFIKEPMDAITNNDGRVIVFMKSAQVAGTEMLLNAIGYYIDQDPSPILVVQPTLEMGLAFSKDRLAPMLRDSPCLKGKVSDVKSKDSSNTLRHKTFTGGQLTIAGANSPASLASRPIRITLFDEVDRFPISAGTEGDPITLGRKRSKTFWNRVSVEVSTPTIAGESRIEMSYEQSTKGRYYVPCPHCDFMQILKWSNVTWDSEKGTDGKNVHDVSSARYECDECHKEINDVDKIDMLAKGEWRHEVPDAPKIGYHISELYSPWSSFSEIAQSFLDAKDSVATLKAWTNTCLGETFEEEGEVINDEGLYNRREKYEAEVPGKVLILTAGVDVQDNRLELEIVGWGDGAENWGIKYAILMGDPTLAEVWDKLTKVLQSQFQHASGNLMGISSCCVDSGGHHTHIVYDYCHKIRPIPNCYAIKGIGGENMPITNIRDLVGYPSKKKALLVGVDAAKSLWFAYLRQVEIGPAYCHFPLEYDPEYFSQLTAEKVTKKYLRGFPKRYWVKIRARNEALDNRVYALAALKILNITWEDLKPLKAPSKEINERIKENKRSARVDNSFLGMKEDY